jgi:nitrate reductase NapAB chaperone NapD
MAYNTSTHWVCTPDTLSIQLIIVVLNSKYVEKIISNLREVGKIPGMFSIVVAIFT